VRKEVKMTCSKFKKQLIPWMDGELQPEKAAELQAWFDSCAKVRQCSECRKLIDEYKSFHLAFHNTPQPEFPAFLHHRIMADIQSRERIYHKKAVRIRWQAVPATIAILFSMYFGSLVGVKTFNAQPSTTTSSLSTEMSSFGENSVVSSLYLNGGLE